MSGFSSALTLDIPRARKVLEHLRAHPEEHDQKFYGRQSPCGTLACIAGTVILQDADTEVSWSRDGQLMAGERGEMEPDGIAAKLLGLSKLDALHLFHDYENDSALGCLESYIVAAEVAQQ